MEGGKRRRNRKTFHQRKKWAVGTQKSYTKPTKKTRWKKQRKNLNNEAKKEEKNIDLKSFDFPGDRVIKLVTLLTDLQSAS